jgi:prepilin peptidase CpaA
MLVFWSVLIAAGCFDWRYRRIPNSINVALFICAVFGQLNTAQPMPASLFLINICIALCLSLPGYFKSVLGGGDVKLLFAVSPAWSPMFFLTSFATGILALTLLMFCSSLLRNKTSLSTYESCLDLDSSDENTPQVFRRGLPLASALCIGSILCAALNMYIISSYK